MASPTPACREPRYSTQYLLSRAAACSGAPRSSEYHHLGNPTYNESIAPFVFSERGYQGQQAKMPRHLSVVVKCSGNAACLNGRVTALAAISLPASHYAGGVTLMVVRKPLNLVGARTWPVTSLLHVRTAKRHGAVCRRMVWWDDYARRSGNDTPICPTCATLLGRIPAIDATQRPVAKDNSSLKQSVRQPSVSRGRPLSS